MKIEYAIFRRSGEGGERLELLTTKDTLDEAVAYVEGTGEPSINFAIEYPDGRWHNWNPAPLHKLYCVFSREALKKMGGNRGKMNSQGGHAFLHAFWNSMDRFPDACAAYRNSANAFKITLVVDTDEDLERLYDAYKDVCGITRVIDKGLTVFNGVPTLTAIGIGPIPESLIGDDLGPPNGPKGLV